MVSYATLQRERLKENRKGPRHWSGLVIHRIDEGDVDDPPVLDTGVTWVETAIGCE
jgi:hypothetical protein